MLDAMDQRIVVAELNIAHFRQKLATEQDQAKRLMLRRLLDEEQAKLASLKEATGTQQA